MSADALLSSRTILGLNQEAYQQLRLATELNLRRQLLLAVCDDVALQQQLSQQLEVDAERNPEADRAAIVTLQVTPAHPSPLKPILNWLKSHRIQDHRGIVPLFQIVGVEQLTRQSLVIQQQFLQSLGRLELLLAHTDMSLLLWVPRPWLHKIRRCAPRFWRMRSRLFEFSGDPAFFPGGDAVPPQFPSPPVSGINSVGNSAEPVAFVPLHGAFPQEVEIIDQPANLDIAASFDGQFEGTTAATFPALVMTDGVSTALQGDEETTNGNGSPPEESETTAVLEPTPTEEVWQHPQLMAQWQQIQLLAEQQAGPLTLAAAHLALGQLCRDMIEAGNQQRDLLDLAIAAYRLALPGLMPESQERCDSLNDLGSLYWLRSHGEEEPDAIATWLQQSIDAYHQALQIPTEVLNDDSLARIHSNLGTAYSLLAGLQEPVANLKQAVRAYHRALSVRPAEMHPAEYATLQNSLGAIHWQLSQIDDARHHLHRAITAYSEALRYRSAESAPQDYAMLQNNLGIAYWSLAQYERPDFLLERSIEAYQSALAFRTLAVDPAGCAATYNNLGTAYWDRAQHQYQPDQLEYWQKSVAAYEQAVVAAQRATAASLPLTFDLWATFHSAGVVHDHIAQRLSETQAEQRAHHLQRALELYNQAVEGWRSDPERLTLLKQGFAHNVRLHFEILGIEGQQQALSQVPRAMLPEVLAQI